MAGAAALHTAIPVAVTARVRRRSMEPKTLNRRAVLRGEPLRKLVFRPEPGPRGDVLISIFLRGGMDGVHAVPPHGDPAYRRQRPTLALPEPGKPGGVVNLDGFFGLHQELA